MTLQESNQRLNSDLQAVIRDAKVLLQDSGGTDGGHIGALRIRLNGALESAKATAHRLQEKAVGAAKATDRAVRSHPYESIGVALGIGVLIGLFARRK